MSEEKIESIKQIGKEIDFEFIVSDQAKAIIQRIPDFPEEHFKLWWKKHFGVVNGGQLNQYLVSNDGLISAPKK